MFNTRRVQLRTSLPIDQAVAHLTAEIVAAEKALADYRRGGIPVFHLLTDEGHALQYAGAFRIWALHGALSDIHGEADYSEAAYLARGWNRALSDDDRALGMTAHVRDRLEVLKEHIAERRRALKRVSAIGAIERPALAMNTAADSVDENQTDGPIWGQSVGHAAG